ncbi:MAG: hypothetical protein AB8B66_05070 [Rickettsiaceae bacterium]
MSTIFCHFAEGFLGVLRLKSTPQKDQANNHVSQHLIQVNHCLNQSFQQIKDDYERE